MLDMHSDQVRFTLLLPMILIQLQQQLAHQLNRHEQGRHRQGRPMAHFKLALLFQHLQCAVLQLDLALLELHLDYLDDRKIVKLHQKANHEIEELLKQQARHLL